MNKKIRTRFAPSPTGYLHIGGLRTALYSYLIAKKLKGEVILRIEDTDKAREVDGAGEKLIEILNWSGIYFDEGPHKVGDYGPYIQSERLEIYQKNIDNLLEKDGAYHCFCTSERLEEMRTRQTENKEAPRYDGKCRELSKGEIQKKLDNKEKFVIRQALPKDGEIVVKDVLRGEIKFAAKDLDDHVLIKSNGIPTYQFASVVDDHLMEITHVIRGEEWISSFPKNILLYQAFGWEEPNFIHLPLILNKEGGKLSKRHNDVAVENYRNAGYLPEALLNFVVLLGWHPKEDEEILTMEEIIEKIEIKDLKISPAVFDTEKLDYFNGYYIREMKVTDLAKKCKPYLKELLEKAEDPSKKEDKYIEKVVLVGQERLKKLEDIKDVSHFFFNESLDYDENLLIWQKLSLEEARENLGNLHEFLKDIKENDWETKILEEKIITYIKEKEAKVGDYLWPMRVALTGEEKSPGPFEVAWVLGKKASLKRIEKAIK